MNLDEIAKQLQIHVNNGVQNNLDPHRKDIDPETLHNIAEAQRLLEVAYRAIGDRTLIQRLDWDEFIETGKKVPHGEF